MYRVDQDISSVAYNWDNAVLVLGRYKKLFYDFQAGKMSFVTTLPRFLSKAIVKYKGHLPHCVTALQLQLYVKGAIEFNKDILFTVQLASNKRLMQLSNICFPKCNNLV